MAFLKDPPVNDRWDCHDFDGGPARRLDQNMDSVYGQPAYADGERSFASARATMFPIRRQPSYTALGQRQCSAYIMSTDWKPPQGCDPTGDMQTIAPVHEDVASIYPLDHANTECPTSDFVPPRLDMLPESLSEFRMASLVAPDACPNFPTLRRSGGPDGIMKTLLAKDLNFTQPTPFANQLAQQIAENTTLYHHDPLSQQPSASETELSYMSVATLSAGRLSHDDTTPFPEFKPPSLFMAVITTGWSYGAKPVSAAHDAMDDNVYQHSPLSDFYEMPGETDDWAVLMQQDILTNGAFEMASFDYPALETEYQTADFQATDLQTTDYQATGSPNDIFNDLAVQYDLEQSLQPAAFDFSGPLLDLSASGYLSGTDQVSYFGSANTSPYEPLLDFFPEAGSSPSFTFPTSADGSPPGITTTANTASPGSDAAGSSSSAAHPFPCPVNGCAKTFRKEAQLKQHQRVHRKALVCDICRAERRTEHKFAQVRDLERHLQARHRDVAERANVRSEVRRCPHPGCEHEGRRDNVSRHHKSKHGKELKWKRGVPHVVG